MSNSVLLVDDDVELAQMLAEYLAGEGFAVACAHDGREAVAQIESERFELVVLDLMLPGMNGFEVLARLRKQAMTPVLMLTARGADEDRIAGLDLGADDYLPKPFNPRELVARMRAILRRFAANGDTMPRRSAIGALEIDPCSFTAWLGGHEVALTGTEFRLLELLANDPGHVVSRDTLAMRVLGRALSPLDRSIDTHVSNIRRKLAETAADQVEIKSVRGKGYVLSILRDAAGAP